MRAILKPVDFNSQPAYNNPQTYNFTPRMDYRGGGSGAGDVLAKVSLFGSIGGAVISLIGFLVDSTAVGIMLINCR